LPPDIDGEALMLVGQALFWRSPALGMWSAAFITINHINFVFIEEPGLEQRFGESNRRYISNVPRWSPRRRPWEG